MAIQGCCDAVAAGQETCRLLGKTNLAIRLLPHMRRHAELAHMALDKLDGRVLQEFLHLLKLSTPRRPGMLM